MEAQNNTNSNRNASMAFRIDLNEIPISSPGRAVNDGASGSASVSICTVCRKGVPGRRAEIEEREQRKEFKCFRCLLNGDGGSSSHSVTRVAEGDDVAVLDSRSGNYGDANTALFNSYLSSNRATPVATRSANFRYQDILQQRTELGSSSRQDNINDGFPIQFQDFCLLSAGHVDWRPSYHSSNQIFPIGYRSSWHDRITGSLFICTVENGGHSGPIFKVQRYPCTKQPIPVGSTVLSKKTVDRDDVATTTTLYEDENNSSTGVTLTIRDIVGEFTLEARSPSSVWDMVSQAFLYACNETYKKMGSFRLYCGHKVHGVNNDNMGRGDSLSRFCYLDGLISIPPLVKNEKELETACGMLFIWLNQDRFGLDTDFVQEIIEQLPGVAASCLNYRKLKDRKQFLSLQTVGSGFFHADRKNKSLYYLHPVEAEDILKRGPCPVGKPLISRLPFYLLGDALQVWGLALRFSEVLGLGQLFSFQELESQLVHHMSDGHLLDSNHRTADMGHSPPSRIEKDSNGRFNGLPLTKILDSLLNLLVSELLSKAARGGKKIKLDMLPVNGLTWHELARRYILAVISMEGNLDFTEIASHESLNLFHCLQGDGGIICGSLTGVAAVEGDAVILGDAMKEIFGSLDPENDFIAVEVESDANDAPDDGVPEWAKVLEPVRKLPTNVGARIKRCINEALEKNPPEWAKQALIHSMSKEVYKGNASGPTKRAVLSVLDMVRPQNPQQKGEKKEKATVTTNVSDLITKQCRIVLRLGAAADEDRVVSNLLGKMVLKANDDDNEGLIGYPAMVTRPLDFRTIDLRLAAGAYGGSHEAFIDDVREIWNNARTAYGDRSDLLAVAQNLSQSFEELYEKEVVTLVQKIDEISNASNSSCEAIKARDELLANIGKTSLPKAPWEEGFCKVCGLDKYDHNGVSCNKCHFEYHRHCLNPTLARIPQGNWRCPSCVAGKSISYISVTNPSRKRTSQGEFTGRLLEKLTRLADLMEVKEYWEFTLDERVFLMKFLFDEALNTATIRGHMDQCASRAEDLQHKLEFLTSELKALRVREETSGQSRQNDNFAPARHLQDSIASVESELLKVSLRKDFLGRDSNGRVYWAFHCRGARPWIVANGGLQSKGKLPEDFASVPYPNNWMYYESNDEIEKLVGWLKEDNVRENELKESILEMQSSKSKDYTEKHLLSNGERDLSTFSSGVKALSPDILATKAMAALEKRFGPIPQMHRCECLELLWTPKDHCSSCKSKQSRNVVPHEKPRGRLGNLHASTSGIQNDEVGFSERYQTTDCPFKLENIMARFVAPSSVKDKVNEIGLTGNGGVPSFLPSEPHYTSQPALSLGPTRTNKSYWTETPSSSRANAVGRVNEMGLIGHSGNPSFLPSGSHYASQPALSLAPMRMDKYCLTEMSSSSRANAGDRVKGKKQLSRLSRFGENGSAAEGTAVESRVKDKSQLLGLSRSSIVRDSSSRPLVGRAYEVLRFLKINLLDIDFALPDDAFRKSRSNRDRRIVWRAFVKSAKSIYEMVQAMIILEDSIETEYLSNDWRFWSSPSTAAKITTISGLALRLCALDSAISYEKPLPNTAQNS